MIDIKEYIEKKKQIQKNLLDFIDNEEDCEENYQNLMAILKDQNIHNNSNELKSLFHLIVKISNNHNRNNNFFNKIEKILLQYKDELLKNFSNHELFDIFKRNKRILLFLLKEEIIKINESISNILTNNKYNENGYSSYFFNEIKNFVSEELKETIQKSIKNDQISYEDNRKIGENESHLCKLIRNDSIDQFISYVNQNNMSLLTPIELSIFETNPFIIKNKKLSLIEYSAFYGSIQIFKYLYLNNVELNKKLWICAIHGRNPEIIHLLEEKKIKLDDDSYFECFNECIKCHHNEMANYIKNNYIDINKKIKQDYEFFSASIKSYNFAFFPNEKVNNELSFYDFCQYDYITIVENLLMCKNIKINSKII